MWYLLGVAFAKYLIFELSAWDGISFYISTFTFFITRWGKWKMVFLNHFIMNTLVIFVQITKYYHNGFLGVYKWLKLVCIADRKV